MVVVCKGILSTKFWAVAETFVMPILGDYWQDIGSAEWGIGGFALSGRFEGGVVQIGNGYYLKGDIYYDVHDRFTDPYNLFNINSPWGEWNPNGVSYDIIGGWKESILHPITPEQYRKFKNR